LRYHLEAEVEVVSKHGISAVPYSYMTGTIKELIKCQLTKYMIWLDTMSLFKSLQRVLRNSIMAGLQMATPAALGMQHKERNHQQLLQPVLQASFGQSRWNYVHQSA
jgi:hypothetical protein